jgi:hypothetical protein
MDIIKYNDFLLLEAKKQKGEVEKAILDLLNKKPTIEKGEFWPNEKGIYSQSTLIMQLKDEFTGIQVGNALADLKGKINTISVKNIKYKHSYPYYYTDLTKEEAEKIKDKYESEDKENNKDKAPKKTVAKKVATKRKPASSKSPVEKKEKK